MCGETYYSGHSRCGYTIRAGQSKMGNITAFPNPTTGIITLGFDAKTSESYTIKISSPEGRELYNGTLGPCLSGRVDYILNMESLPTGPYRISIIAPDWTVAILLMLIK